MKSELTITPKGDTLTLLEGKALELKHPDKLKISGQIESVNKYMAARKATEQAYGSLQHINRDLAVITVDDEAMSIHLDVDPNSPFGTEVVGTLEMNPDLLKFQLNQNYKFSREALVELIRMNRRFFADIVENGNVVSALQRLKISTTGSLEAGSDTRGNKESAFKKTVDSAVVPQTFVLFIPIFKGQPAKKFVVDLCLDTTENNVRFWLESVELIEIAQADKKAIISAQLADYLDYCIIWK